MNAPVLYKVAAACSWQGIVRANYVVGRLTQLTHLLSTQGTTAFAVTHRE